MKRNKLLLIAFPNKGGIRVEAANNAALSHRQIKEGRNRYQCLEGSSNRSDLSPRRGEVSAKKCAGMRI